jgi:hypothetical protein
VILETTGAFLQSGSDHAWLTGAGVGSQSFDRGSVSWRKTKKIRGLNAKISTFLQEFTLMEGYGCESKNYRVHFAKQPRRARLTGRLGRSRPSTADRAADTAVDRAMDHGPRVHREPAKGVHPELICIVHWRSGGPGGP